MVKRDSKGRFVKGHQVPIKWKDSVSKTQTGRKKSKNEIEDIKIRVKKEHSNGIRKDSYKKISKSLTGRKLSQKHVDNIIKSHKGLHCSPSTEFKKGEVSGENNPFYGKKHSKKSIEKYKEKRRTWVTPKKDTSIEVKIQNFLKQLGIEFFTHQYMKIEHGYQCDILIPSMNLVIECDGDYWHKYPVGREIDHIRTSELLSEGFKVLRLWEFEIKSMGINEFEGRLKDE